MLGEMDKVLDTEPLVGYKQNHAPRRASDHGLQRRSATINNHPLLGVHGAPHERVRHV